MDLNMDITKINSNFDTGLPTPGSFLQPHSRNPSISHQSPMYETGTSVFEDPMIGQGVDLPDNDFALFGGDNISPFSNPAAASATLFPASEFAVLDNDPLFDEGFVDFDMTN
jgi:hypothetical protein